MYYALSNFYQSTSLPYLSVLVTLQGQVYMYYALSNFYQSNRRYVRSLDAYQLSGKVTRFEDLSSACDPLRGVNGVPYAPCGAIANSLFNGTWTSPVSFEEIRVYG